MIRPKDCSRGKTNNSSERKNCSGVRSSHSAMCHLQKNRHSIGIDDSLQHTCTKKYHDSNRVDLRQVKSDSQIKGLAMIKRKYLEEGSYFFSEIFGKIIINKSVGSIFL